MNFADRMLRLAQREGILLEPPTGPGPGSDARTGGLTLQGLVDGGRLRPEAVDRLLRLALAESSMEGAAPMPESWVAGTAVAVEEPKDWGRYRNLQLLGAGGQGRVYRAFDTQLQRPVALKLLARADAEAHLAEARLQAQVEHPNVCKVFDAGELEGRPYIALQLVEGRTLAEVPLLREAAVAALRDVAEALHFAHRKGLLHLDLKPGNILLEIREQGQVHPLVTDFGLATLQARPGPVPWGPYGTPPYAAPEQLDPTAAPPDRRTDVYGLGATLYTLLADLPPYEAPDRAAMVKAILGTAPIPLLERAPSVPKDLAAVVAKAMARGREARYPSALAFSEDLQRWLDGMPVLAVTSTALDRGVAWAKRNPLASKALTVATVVTVLAGTALAWMQVRARGDALAAARLGSVASEMETFLRQEYLLPPHDLRPAFAHLRARVTALKGDTRKASRAPRAYALGRAYLLLGNWEGARQELGRARDWGFNTPECDLAFGLALGEVYQRRAAEARSIPTEARRKARLAELEQEFRVPAVAVIRGQAAFLPERTATLLARVALLEEQPEEALRLAEAARSAPAEQAEALRLEGAAHLERRRQLDARGAHRDALAALDLAEAALVAARDVARSDPGIALALAEAVGWRLSHERALGLAIGPSLERAQQFLAAAKNLHAEDPSLLKLEAHLLQQGGIAQEATGQMVIKPFEEALERMEQAVRVAPERGDLWAHLAYSCYALAARRNQLHLDPGPVFHTGERAVKEALRHSPQDWRGPWYGTLLASAEALDLNLRGMDARAAAQRGAGWAAKALDLGGHGPVRYARGVCLTHLAVAEFNAGQNPGPNLDLAQKVLEEAVALVPNDQILRVNASDQALTASILLHFSGREGAPALARARALLEGIPPVDMLKSLAHLKVAVLELRLGMGTPTPATATALAQRLRDFEARYKLPVPYERGYVTQALAQSRLAAGLDPAAAFAEARRCLAEAEQQDRKGVDAPNDRAFAALTEARWRMTRNQPVLALLEEARAAIQRSRSIHPGQALLSALEAAALELQSHLGGPQREALRAEAGAKLQEALRRNPNLRGHPDLKPLRMALEK
jgi:serine/threonine-protein kinase